jgi:hypothetical protein
MTAGLRGQDQLGYRSSAMTGVSADGSPPASRSYCRVPVTGIAPMGEVTWAVRVSPSIEPE